MKERSKGIKGRKKRGREDREMVVGRLTIVLLIKEKSVRTCGRKDQYDQVHLLVSDLNKKNSGNG